MDSGPAEQLFVMVWQGSKGIHKSDACTQSYNVYSICSAFFHAAYA